MADQLIILDTTRSYEDTAFLYRDQEFIEMVNITGTENISFGAENLTLVINPTYESIISSPNNPDFISYWWHNIRYYFFGIIFIIILTVVIWNIYKRY